ncbi:MAG TPA: hydroxymethylbilane synthase [Acidobacteriota bacterium]|nr:hydroxymethylbilane synthase [Acidobacteriota bacterium]
MKRIVIGSRGSRLAITQTQSIVQLLTKFHPDLQIEIEIIKTSGDQITDTPLSRFPGDSKGLFVKEIEEALIDGRIDLAVHSLKDLPSTLPEGLTLAAFPRREDPRDAFIGRNRITSLDELPANARIGTGSLRRKVQLLNLRPDLIVEDIRGNVDTRLRKLSQQGLDGIILARAGLIRMGLEDTPAFVFSTEEMIPAVGQGVLALEIREDDSAMAQLVAPLNDSETGLCAASERLFLHHMGGGCRVPMGAFASLQEQTLRFDSFVADPSTRRFAKFSGVKAASQSDELVEEAVRSLESQGAKEILQALHSGTQ